MYIYLVHAMLCCVFLPEMWANGQADKKLIYGCTNDPKCHHKGTSLAELLEG